MSARWVVLGAGGMLGHDVLRALHGRDAVGLARRDVDITDEAAVLDAVAGADVVVNCAAWTAVDDAEEHELEALAVNGIGAEHVAHACLRTGSRLVHVSTDYVFAGDAATPYAEDAPVAPRTAYGRTKAVGEEAVRRVLPDRSVVVRTAWLYGAAGPSFVRTMARLERERDTVEVVDDQQGQPTWSHDLAERIVAAVDHEVAPGIYHGTNAGATTWFGLARAVFELLGADPERVRPTTSAAFVRPAPRPAYSVLGHDAWVREGLEPMRPWRDALEAAFADDAFHRSLQP